MSIASLVEKELPYLRRYARAVMGDLISGDQQVEATLEAVLRLKDDPGFDSKTVNKAFLFGLLERELSADFEGDRAEQSRRALLLTAMESFPSKTAAKILSVDSGAFAELMKGAEEALLDALAARLLIIEDEPIIGEHLRQISESAGHEVVGIAARASEAIVLYTAEQPDIILADIQLEDGSLGTEAVATMDLPDTVPVIYITAYPERMLRAKDEGPTYLITKPFQPDYVKALISHALLRATKKRLMPKHQS